MEGADRTPGGATWEGGQGALPISHSCSRETRDTRESRGWWATWGRCLPPQKQLAVWPTATGNGREQPGPRPRASLAARPPVLSPGGRLDIAPRQAAVVGRSAWAQLCGPNAWI